MNMQFELDELLESSSPLPELAKFVWRTLQAATTERGHPFAAGCFSTVASVGNAKVPQSRTVIVRQVDLEQQILDFYTDARSAKTAQLQNQWVSWLFYDRTSKIQFRLTGTAAIIAGEAADQAWESTPLESRVAYLAIADPGQAIAGSHPPTSAELINGLADSERGKLNFRIVRTQVDTVEVLYLRTSGHVRATIAHSPDGVKAYWQVP